MAMGRWPFFQLPTITIGALCPLLSSTDRHKRSGDVPSVISRDWNSNSAASANDVFEAAAVSGKAKGDFRFRFHPLLFSPLLNIDWIARCTPNLI